MLKIEKIDHVGIATADLQASKDFFAGILGLIADEDICIAERNLKICFFKVGDSALEFVMPTAPESPMSEHLNQYGAGAYHVALGVTDINAALATLKQNNIPLKDQEPRASKIGAHVAFIEQNTLTGNMSFELLERDR
mgnify:CR=1 FL=1